MKFKKLRKMLRDDQKVFILQNDVFDIDAFEDYMCNIPKTYDNFYVSSLTTKSLMGYSQLVIELAL